MEADEEDFLGVDATILEIVENELPIMKWVEKRRWTTVDHPHYLDTSDKKREEHMESGRDMGSERSPQDGTVAKSIHL